MAMLKKIFVGRRPFAYVLLASAVVMLLCDILYIALGGAIAATAGKSNYLVLSFVLILLGSLLSLASFCLPLEGLVGKIGRNLPAASAILYGFGLGMQCYQVSFPLADLLTKVYFFGGNWVMGVIFIVVFFLGAIADVVYCCAPNEVSKLA